MRTIAAIRTHVWGEEARRLHAQLAPVFGADLVVVFHNRPAGLDLPLPVVDIDDAWVAGQGLRVLPDWGWRCGDYFLYALRAARPDADRFWLIEPDVYFSADPAPLFARLETSPEDALGVRIEPLPANDVFMRHAGGRQLHRAIFAFTRWSAPVLDWLLDLRRRYSADLDPARKPLNDECFCFTHLVEQDRFTHADMAERAPGLISPAAMLTDPDILMGMVRQDLGSIVHHPVRERDSFIGSVAARMALRLSRNGAFILPALPYLSEADVRSFCSELSRHLEPHLIQQCGSQLRRRGRVAIEQEENHHA
ncbi:MAG: component of SufBCD complex [Gemmobacter sp.]